MKYETVTFSATMQGAKYWMAVATSVKNDDGTITELPFPPLEALRPLYERAKARAGK